MALNELNVKLGLLTKDFQRELNKTQRSLRKFQRNIGNIGSDLTQSITVPLVAAGVAAVRGFAGIERQSKALETALGGGAEAARVELEKLRKAAENPGLGFEQAIQGSVRLQAVGFTADESRNSLLAFGNAIALAGGTAQDLDGVTLALTQIASKGKVSAEEINQIAERVPQIRQTMQDAFGTTSGQAIEKLGISAKDFVNIVTTEIGKLPQATNTLSNVFQNTFQSLQLVVAGFGEEIAKAFDFEDLTGSLVTGAQNLLESFRNLDDSTKRTITRIALFAAATGPALIAVSKLTSVLALAVKGFATIAAAAKALPALLIAISNPAAALTGKFALLSKGLLLIKTSLVAFFTSPIGLAIAAAAALGAGLVVLYKRSEDFRDSVNALGAKVSSAFDTIKVALGALGRSVVEVLGSAFGNVSFLVAEATNAIKSVLGAARSFAGAFFSLFSKALQNVTGSFLLFGKDSAGTFANLFSDITTIFDNIGRVIGGFVAGGIALLTSFFEIIGRLGSELASGFNSIREGDIVQGLKTIGSVIVKGNPIGIAVTEGKNLAGSFRSGFDRGFEQFSLKKVASNFKKNFEEGLKASKLEVPASSIDIPEIEVPVKVNTDEVERTLKGLGAKINPQLNIQSIATPGAQLAQLGVLTAASGALDTYNEKVRQSNIELLKQATNLSQIPRVFETIDEKFAASTAVAEAFNLKIRTIADGIGELGDYTINWGELAAQAIRGIGDGFASAISGVQSFGQAFLQVSATIVKALVQQGIAAAIANNLKLAKVLGPLAIPLAAAAGVAAKALFSKFVGLADGGIIPPGFPNDSFPARLSSNEAVIPLDRLPGLLAKAQPGAGGFVAEARISGEDLLILINRAQKGFNRYS